MSVEQNGNVAKPTRERSEEAPPQKAARFNPVLIGVILIVLLAACAGWYLYAQRYRGY